MTAVPDAAAPSPDLRPPETPVPAAPGGRVFPTWVLVVGALVVVAGVVLRFVTTSDLWLDEALTVNISRLPLGDLHEALRHDGAPPLFYLLLHGWISVFGSGDFAVRALSGVISVATLPVIWFAGRRLGRPGPPGPIAADPPRARLVAGIALLLLASSPYAIRYATEARMYALVILLVALGYLALRRACEQPSLTRLALVAVIVGALLYTQYWSFYLLAVVGAAVLWRAWRAPALDERRAARSVLVAMIAGLIMFSPWIPTFVYQSAHTGTPWGNGQVPFSSFRVTIDQFGNGTSLLHAQSNLLTVVFIALTLLAVFGRTVGTSHVDIDLRTQPEIRWEAGAAFGALGLGLVAAWITDSAFDARYASMMFPLFVLVVAFGFTVLGSRLVMGILVAVVVGAGFAGAANNVVDNRTQAGQLADVIRADAKPGDTVVYCPDQLGPSVARLLESRPGLDQVTFPGGAAPELVDWVDYHHRIAATDPAKFANRVLDQAGKDHAIWYVYSPAYHGLEGKCEGVAAALAAARPGSSARVVQDDQKYFESGSLVQYPAG
jgi:hypothetical protein